MKDKVLQNKFENLLSELNPDWQDDPDMKETPDRLSRMYMHFFRNEDPKIHLEKKFPTNNTQLVIVKNIECFGMCPHHLVPVIYNIHIGYNPNGWALGLSKLARIAVAIASYPKLQENLTTEIAQVIYDEIKPQGVMVVVEGIHGCMRCRGVEQDSTAITSDIKGTIVTEDFYNILALGK